MTFDEFFGAALGDASARPYPHQVALATEGLPEVLTAPTGTGKTEAAVLGHLYRRTAHPDQSVRDGTPRWLILALPTRGLVSQTVDRIETWVANLGIDLPVHTVMGGESWDDRRWRMAPRSDAVFVGTVDMLLSRALNRGYVDSQWSWPISFGLFNNGVQWVFDEVQQMELATVSSRQLQAFRDSLGTVTPTRSMWMSATLDDRLLRTVDAPEIETRVDAMSFDEIPDHLRTRIDAPKQLEELVVTDRKKQNAELAEAVLAAHRSACEEEASGTLTLAVVNTVSRAQELAKAIEKEADDIPVVLLHRRFRSADRDAQAEQALAPIDPDGPGRIVVSTQVLEAGIDIDATTLLTELAPWSSLTQRAGRCNRAGVAEGARLLWIDLDDRDAAPYDPAELDDARATLRELDGQAVTPSTLVDAGPAPPRRIHHVLRRRDLIELFDTSPDLSGDPLDVSQFIRDGEERDVFIAWRAAPTVETLSMPEREELCPVSLTEARKWLNKERSVWRRDPQGSSRQWVPMRKADLKPGLVVIAAAAEGGYLAERGWSRSSKDEVPEVPSDDTHGSRDDVTVSDEPASMIGAWYPLSTHLDDVDRVAADIVDVIAPDLPTAMRSACVDAGALHDLGKAHDVWQRAALSAGGEDPDAPDGLVAKTPGRGRLRFEQRHFRHELASLTALRGHAAHLLDDTPEPDLCRYLVAAHHGRVRLSVRSIPGEADSDTPVILGVVDGSTLPQVDTPRGTSPGGSLDITALRAEWTGAALHLRDRADLGPFRLAFLEAVVRLADWEASSQIAGGVP